MTAYYGNKATMWRLGSWVSGLSRLPADHPRVNDGRETKFLVKAIVSKMLIRRKAQ